MREWPGQGGMLLVVMVGVDSRFRGNDGIGREWPGLGMPGGGMPVVAAGWIPAFAGMTMMGEGMTIDGGGGNGRVVAAEKFAPGPIRNS